jgi:hypothetical protein
MAFAKVCIAVVLTFPVANCKRSGAFNDSPQSPIVQTADDPASSFDAFTRRAAEATNNANPINLNRWTNKWVKRRFKISEMKMDVRKTDSLVTPIVGIVSYLVYIEATIDYATEAEAREAQRFVERFHCTYELKLRYGYKDGKWSLLDGTQAGGIMNLAPLNLTAETIKKEPEAIPNIVLMEWIGDAAR